MDMEVRAKYFHSVHNCSTKPHNCTCSESENNDHNTLKVHMCTLSLDNHDIGCIDVTVSVNLSQDSRYLKHVNTLYENIHAATYLICG